MLGRKWLQLSSWSMKATMPLWYHTSPSHTPPVQTMWCSAYANTTPQQSPSSTVLSLSPMIISQEPIHKWLSATTSHQESPLPSTVTYSSLTTLTLDALMVNTCTTCNSMPPCPIAAFSATQVVCIVQPNPQLDHLQLMPTAVLPVYGSGIWMSLNLGWEIASVCLA